MRDLFRLMSSELMLGLVAVVGIFALINRADADWGLETLDDGTTLAVLFDAVQPEDSSVPTADAYCIKSTGGDVEAGFAIATVLKAKGKPVYYTQALSIAASIAVETNAEPLNEEAILGFHWTYSAASQGRYVPDAESQAVMLRVWNSIDKKWGTKVGTKIKGAMIKIVSADQRTSMVVINAKGQYMIIKNNKPLDVN